MCRGVFHIVLHEPEIPNNTGNIGRTCVATGCDLHLIHPLGFSTDEKACRRAGLDYWPRLAPREYPSYAEYRAATAPRRTWFLTTKGTRPPWDVQFAMGDHLVFGKETSGLPDHVLQVHSNELITMPMVAGERSLNLATAVCAVIYEGIRQLVARGELMVRPDGRLAGAGGPTCGASRPRALS